MKKLAIAITHPIQYYVPVFRLLARQCELKVFYTWGADCIKPKHDPGFGKTIDWDLPLLEGYEYELLENTSKNPGSHHGKGIINPNIITQIELFEPNAILVYGYIYQSHFRVMRHFKGKIPIWFRGDSTLLDEQSGFKAIAKTLYLKWVYNYVDKAFYVGTNNKSYFKKYGLKDEKLIFAPHAIDNQRFSNGRKVEVDDLRTHLGLRQSDLLILFAGKLEPKKNPSLLLEAFIELNEEQYTTNHNSRTAHLLFVGNGILEKGLKSKVESLKLKNVHFLDFQNQTQMPVVYQACDIFCLPSQGPGETWGLAINEAMAAGKAIIASDKVGCTKDLIQENKNGYIFKSIDVLDLKKKIALLINQPSLIKAFGKESRKIITDWSFEHQVEQFMKQLNATN